MSLSNEWFEYHLTPAGWVEGTESLDFAGEKPRPIPTDRVLTVRFHDQLSSAFSKPHKWSGVTWKSDDADAIRRLQRRHGTCPAGFDSWATE